MTAKEALKILQNKLNPCLIGEWKEATDMAISALEAQESSQNVSNDDFISRKVAIDALDSLHYNDREDWCFVLDTIEYLPSAQPERKTCEGCKHRGKWDNELVYGYSCPCIRCKRIMTDHYERRY